MAPKQTTPDEPRHPTVGMEDDPIAQMLIKGRQAGDAGEPHRGELVPGAAGRTARGRGRLDMTKPASDRIGVVARAINRDPSGDLFGHLIEQITWTPETIDGLVRHLLGVGITEEVLADAVRDAAKARMNRQKLLRAAGR